MPVLPDLNDLGQRPTPVSNRQITSVRNAGVVGEAVSQLGEKVSAAVEHIQQVHDEDTARRLDVQHAEAASKIRQEALQATGTEAEPARQRALQQLDELNQQTLSQAHSRPVRDAVSSLIDHRSIIEREAIGTHAYQQTTAAIEAGMTARVETGLQQTEDHWDNPDAVESGLNTAVTEINNRGQWRHEDPAVTANAVAAARARVRSSVVEQRIATEDYRGAQDYLHAHFDEIDQEHRIRLQHLINGELDLEQANTDAAAAVGAAPAHAPAPGAAPGTPAPPAGSSHPINEGNQPARFQVDGWTVGDGYGAARAGHIHQGVDIFAAAGTPFPVGRPFDVLESHRQTSGSGAGGNIAHIRFQEDGSEWFAMHLPDLPASGHYAAGAEVLRSGHTGNAAGTDAHIHWQPANAAAQQIYNRGRHDVAAYLTGGETGPHTPPVDGTRVDLQSAYAWINAQPWAGTARGRRAMERVQQLASEGDRVRAQVEDEADRQITQALVGITSGGGRLTNLNQLPPSALTRASPSVLLQLNEQITANNRPTPPPANSPLANSLIVQAADDPNGFLRINPEMLRGRITDEEVQWIVRTQTEIQHRPGTSPSDIMSMIRMVVPDTSPLMMAGASSSSDQTAAQRRQTQTNAQHAARAALEARLLPAVQARLRATHGQAVPTPQDVMAAVQAEVTLVHTPGGTMPIFAARNQGQGYAVSVPRSALPTIDQALRNSGLPITDNNRTQLYLQHRTELDAATR